MLLKHLQPFKVFFQVLKNLKNVSKLSLFNENFL